MHFKRSSAAPEQIEWTSGSEEAQAWDSEERALLHDLKASPGSQTLDKWLLVNKAFGRWRFTVADGGLVKLWNDDSGAALASVAPYKVRHLAPHGYWRPGDLPFPQAKAAAEKAAAEKAAAEKAAAERVRR